MIGKYFKNIFFWFLNIKISVFSNNLKSNQYIMVDKLNILYPKTVLKYEKKNFY